VAARGVHFFLQAKRLPFLGHPVLDAAVYHAWAKSIVAGQPFGDGPFYQSPGYSYFLAMIYALAGARPLVAVAVQSALGVATLLLTALLGRRLLGPKEGIVAGALLLGMAPFYFEELKLLDVTLSVFLAVLAVYMSIVAGRGPKHGRAAALGLFVLAGLAAGLLSVVRANLLVVPALVLAVWTVQALRRRYPGPNVLAYGVGMIVALVPPMAHNLSHGAAVPVATSGGFNFYLGNFRGATGVFTDVPGTTGVIATQEAEADSLVLADLGRSLAPAQESRYWLRRGVSEIVADPLHWAGLLGKKTRLFLNRQEETINGSLELEKSRILLLRLAAVPWNLLLALAVVGVFLVHRERGEKPPTAGKPDRTLGTAIFAGWSTAAAVVIGAALSCVLFFVLTRLRLPAAPVLAILAAHTLVRGAEAVRARALRPLAIISLAVVVFTALTWRSPLGAARNPQWESMLVVEAAKALDQEGKTARAEAAYRLARELDPGSVDALLGEAEDAVSRGDLPAAVQFYEQARGISPDRFPVRNNLGILYYTVGRMDDCAREMEAATSLDSRSGTPLYYRGLVARGKGDPRWRELLVSALERDPSQAGPYTVLLEDAVTTGDMEAARRWAEAARKAGVELPPELLSRIR
jgi:4-amino-4-deoxy-L-arabinose transferase-like glycosyltransferase